MHTTVQRFITVSILLAPLASVRAQGGTFQFCTTGSSGARISASGSASFTAQGGSGDLVLHAAPIAAGAPGLFVMASGVHQPLPFGLGFSCVGGNIHRLPIVIPGAGQNEATFALDYLDPSTAASLITPGSTWFFQFWFRSSASFDLTDGIAIQFVPPVSLVGSSTVAQGEFSQHPLASSNNGAITLVENDNDWTSLWNQHQIGFPPAPPPFVDFTADVVVAAFGGWRPSSGYDISVQSLTLSVAELDVGTRERAPGAGCGVLTVITYPYHFVRVPRVPFLELRNWTRAFHSAPCP